MEKQLPAVAGNEVDDGWTGIKTVSWKIWLGGQNSWEFFLRQGERKKSILLLVSLSKIVAVGRNIVEAESFMSGDIS